MCFVLPPPTSSSSSNKEALVGTKVGRKGRGGRKERGSSAFIYVLEGGLGRPGKRRTAKLQIKSSFAREEDKLCVVFAYLCGTLFLYRGNLTAY